MTDRFGPASRWAGRAVAALVIAVVALQVVRIARNPSAVMPVTPGDVAPYFALPRIDGQGHLALEDLRGQVVMLDFWATWCGPCRDSMPAIERVYRRLHARGFEVVSINTDDPDGRATARAFARELGLSFPIVVDEEGFASHLYGVRRIPHMVLIDRRGLVRDVHYGAPRDFEAALTAQVEALLGEN